MIMYILNRNDFPGGGGWGGYYTTYHMLNLLGRFTVYTVCMYNLCFLMCVCVEIRIGLFFPVLCTSVYGLAESLNFNFALKTLQMFGIYL